MGRHVGDRFGLDEGFAAAVRLYVRARGKPLACGVSLAALGAVLWPVRQNWRSLPLDGFPFSYYPMFSAQRGGTSSVTCVLGVDSHGQRHSVHYRHAGFGGLNQVRRHLRRMAIEERAGETCAFVIANLARERPALLGRFVAVQLVTRTYRLDEYFGGESREPIREKVHVTVPVSVPAGPSPVLAQAPDMAPMVTLHGGPA